MWLPVAAALFADLTTLGVYSVLIVFFVYTGHLMSALCGSYLVRGLALSTRLPVAVLAASVGFYLVSNLGSWWVYHPRTTSVAIDAPLHVCIGAVLSGGLFGDHSSPISETTILSSTGASCPQIEHFRTQLPYALFNGTISLSAFVVTGVTGSALIILGALAAQIAGLLVIRRMQSPS